MASVSTPKVSDKDKSEEVGTSNPKVITETVESASPSFISLLPSELQRSTTPPSTYKSSQQSIGQSPDVPDSAGKNTFSGYLLSGRRLPFIVGGYCHLYCGSRPTLNYTLPFTTLCFENVGCRQNKFDCTSEINIL